MNLFRMVLQFSFRFFALADIAHNAHQIFDHPVRTVDGRNADLSFYCGATRLHDLCFDRAGVMALGGILNSRCQRGRVVWMNTRRQPYIKMLGVCITKHFIKGVIGLLNPAFTIQQQNPVSAVIKDRFDPVFGAFQVRCALDHPCF